MTTHSDKRKPARRRAWRVACGLLPLCASAHAVDLSWQPQLRLGMRATDNVRWSSDAEEAALGFDNGGGMVVKAEGANWHSNVTPSFNFRRFGIGKNLDADEYGVRSNHQWKASESLEANLEVDYQRDSTLTSELTDAGLRNDVGDRDTVTVAPSLSYMVNDANYVTASYLYSNVSFSAGGDSGLTDYTYEQVTSSWTHVVSDRLKVSATGNVSHFLVPSFSSRTWTYGGEIGASYAYAADLTFDASVGYSQSQINFLDRIVRLRDPIELLLDPTLLPFEIINVRSNVSTGGPIASFSVLKTFESLRSKFDYSRQVSPSIRGSQTLDDEITVSVERDLSRRVLLGLRGGYNMRTAQAEGTAISRNETGRDQIVAIGSLTYQWSPQISVRSEYRFIHSSFPNGRKSVDASAAFFTLTYNGDPHIYRGF